MKYQLITVSGVHVSIGKQIGDNPNYTESIIDTVFPTDREIDTWSGKRLMAWQKHNNKRMLAIKDFLNNSNL
jgi:hypothetical protein